MVNLKKIDWVKFIKYFTKVTGGRWGRCGAHPTPSQAYTSTQISQNVLCARLVEQKVVCLLVTLTVSGSFFINILTCISRPLFRRRSCFMVTSRHFSEVVKRRKREEGPDCHTDHMPLAPACPIDGKRSWSETNRYHLSVIDNNESIGYTNGWKSIGTMQVLVIVSIFMDFIDFNWSALITKRFAPGVICTVI